MTAADGVDAVVVGGGPAGSTAATMLAREGRRVVLLERERFPREHIGESLLPASVPILEELGAREAVEAAGFLPKYGATMVWGREAEPWSWYFRETNAAYPSSWQVWRAEFDRILLENSRSAGADCREGHRVVSVLFDGDRATGVRYVDDTGREAELEARFVVDASGQSALVGSARGLRKWDPFFRNLAVYAYFEGARRLDAPDETNILVEAYPDGWLWTIPLHTGWASVGAVVDRDVAQGRVRPEEQEAFLREQIARAPQTSRLLAGARLVHGPFVLKDWSYASDEVVGEGWVLAGDAACFVDPLFSSGVHLALTSGMLAAAYVLTALDDPELAPEAGRAYKEHYYAQYDNFHRMASLFYASNRTQESYFWEARRLLGGSDAYSPRHAFIHAVAGQPPRGYERVVLDRGQLPESLIESVRSAEQGLARRRQEVAAAGERLLAAVPRLDDDVEVLAKPVLEGRRFVRGEVITSPMRPLGTPASPLAAAMVRLVDGRRSVAEIAAELRGRVRGDVDLERVVSFAIGTLYVEGAVTELAGLHAAP